jgi:hypothetical protein
MEFLFGGLTVVVAVVGGGLLFRSRALRRAEESVRRERNAQIIKEDIEAAAAPLLVPEPQAIDVDALTGQITGLISEFEELATFEDVHSWDRRAEAAALLVDESAKALLDFIEQAKSAVDAHRKSDQEPHHVKMGRINKTTKAIDEQGEIVRELFKTCDLLHERIDMTPDNKKEQSAILRELNADRRELKKKQKELQDNVYSVHKAAIRSIEDAGFVGFTGWQRYDPRVAAIERRAIRRARDAALAPQETAISALERQIAAVDERISWVERFGEDDDE